MPKQVHKALSANQVEAGSLPVSILYNRVPSFPATLFWSMTVALISLYMIRRPHLARDWCQSGELLSVRWREFIPKRYLFPPDPMR